MLRKLLTLSVLFTCCAGLQAQQQQIPKETLRTTGKIIGLFNAGYYVELDSGQKWTIFEKTYKIKNAQRQKLSTRAA